MKILRFKENNAYQPIKSFGYKEELCPSVWDGFKLRPNIRKQLNKIAKDFVKSTDIPMEIVDIHLVGSLVNYNWDMKYSDYDLHIIVDFKKVDENMELLRITFDSLKTLWNKKHDIEVSGFEVEVYLQDVDDEINSNGIFSLKTNEWLKKPEKLEYEVNTKEIKDKSKSIINDIDDLEKDKDGSDYKKLYSRATKILKKIKKFRKMSLNKPNGEYSTGNLIFKLLRRNGYTSKVMDLKTYFYDKQFE